MDNTRYFVDPMALDVKRCDIRGHKDDTTCVMFDKNGNIQYKWLSNEYIFRSREEAEEKRMWINMELTVWYVCLRTNKVLKVRCKKVSNIDSNLTYEIRLAGRIVTVTEREGLVYKNSQAAADALRDILRMRAQKNKQPTTQEPEMAQSTNNAGTADTTNNTTNNAEDIMSHTIQLQPNQDINTIEESVAATISKARQEAQLFRGYSVLFNIDGERIKADDKGARQVADVVKDGGEFSVEIAPSRKKDAVKFILAVTVTVAPPAPAKDAAPAAAPVTVSEAKEDTTEGSDDTSAARAKAIELGIGEMPFGAFVWWNMRNIKITPEDARRIAVEELRGTFEPHEVQAYADRIQDIDANSTILTEGKRWRHIVDGEKFTSGIVSADQHTVTFAIKRNIVHTVDGKKRNDDLQIDTVTWDMNSEAWLSTGNTVETKQFVFDMAQKITYLTTKGIRPVVQRMVHDMDAICLKDQGGFYLVAIDAVDPDASLDRLAAIRSFVSRFGNSQMMVATQSSQSALEACEDDVRDHLDFEIGELEEKIARWSADTKHTASNNLERAIADFGAIKSKSKLFAKAMQMRAADLIDRIEVMENTVLEMQQQKPEGKERTATAEMLDNVRELLENGHREGDTIFVDVDDIAAAQGMHESASDVARAVTHWKRLTSGGRAARHFGYRGVDVVAFDAEDNMVDVGDDKALEFFVKFTPFGTAQEELKA